MVNRMPKSTWLAYLAKGIGASARIEHKLNVVELTGGAPGPQQRRETHGNNSDHHSDPPAYRRVADVAVQYRMGLLPQWRPWFGAPYPHHFGFDGKVLSTIRQKSRGSKDECAIS